MSNTPSAEPPHVVAVRMIVDAWDAGQTFEHCVGILEQSLPSSAARPVAWAVVEPGTNDVIAAFPDEQAAITARPSMDHDTIPLYASPQSATRFSGQHYASTLRSVAHHCYDAGMDDDGHQLEDIADDLERRYNEANATDSGRNSA